MSVSNYDVVVIGGGHAGVEAASIAAKLGSKTLLVTQSKKSIAMMPCNPSIGGPAKGVVVREIAALGGIMGEAADKSCLQSKILNTRKGPGVWAIRNQIDKEEYHNQVMKILEGQSNLSIQEDLIQDIKKIKGNKYKVIGKKEYVAKTIVITTGTYSSSLVLQGLEKRSEGPDNLKTTKGLSNWFKKNSIALIRLKTGTPPRVLTKSINLKEMRLEEGNNSIWTFGDEKPLEDKRLPCYLTHTNENTHQIIRENLKTSLLFDRDYKIKGPSRCPSIEDKIFRFKDKDQHQIFVEPDTADYSVSYLQGLSTSLDRKTQDKMLVTIKGFENVKILKYAYAIEYDVVQPTQLRLTLELKKTPRVFTAGQINGSSGYEEAAGQGLVAGINASKLASQEKKFIMPRNSSYIGMLIDDLVTKGVEQPYRLLTSMMTYRMYVRSDNAYIRLYELARKHGLLDRRREVWIQKYLDNESKARKLLKKLNVNNVDFLKLAKKDTARTNFVGLNGLSYCASPNGDLRMALKICDEKFENSLSYQTLEMIRISLRYEGYIKREGTMLLALEKKEEVEIPDVINYKIIDNISKAALDELIRKRPATLGQALRLERVTISDIVVLEKYIAKNMVKDL